MITLNDIGKIVLDIEDKCTHCGRETGAGSGLWVDRIPSHTDAEQASEWLTGWQLVQYVDGYLCRECLEVE
jgi:hypothetical protein